ncbi:MAG: thiamine pyrophosphate-dependent enzyme, partial [Deltaproteobacteria bacterium]
RPVLCASGDMGAMCNIGELETAMREKIPVVYVVFNDQGLGNERAFQNEHYDGRFFAVDYNNPDFGALARVFGAHGEQVTRPEDLEAALRRPARLTQPAILGLQHADAACPRKSRLNVRQQRRRSSRLGRWWPISRTNRAVIGCAALCRTCQSTVAYHKTGRTLSLVTAEFPR